MPIPWAVAAKAIPWGEVIAAAPSIVRGARELLSRTRGEAGDASAGTPATPEERIGALEARVEALAGELETSTDLITQLAEHNERLVVAVERLHRQLSLALVVGGVALLGAIAALLLP
ncbi:MAG: hypothetical protein KDH20_22040 [Rhodocyclaceae bacterium]|nr:hypothetical protein [Rhodocyclaceae bacterium]